MPAVHDSQELEVTLSPFGGQQARERITLQFGGRATQEMGRRLVHFLNHSLRIGNEVSVRSRLEEVLIPRPRTVQFGSRGGEFLILDAQFFLGCRQLLVGRLQGLLLSAKLLDQLRGVLQLGQVGGDDADAQAVGLVQDVGRDVRRDGRAVGSLEDQPLLDGLLLRGDQKGSRRGAVVLGDELLQRVADDLSPAAA